MVVGQGYEGVGLLDDGELLDGSSGEFLDFAPEVGGSGFGRRFGFRI